MVFFIDVLDRIIAKLAGLADTPAINWLGFYYAATTLKTGLELYLDKRQWACSSRPKPPPELDGSMSLETYRKAQAYGRDKMKYTLYKTAADFTLDIGLLAAGIMPKTWELAGKVMDAVGLAPSRTIARSLIWTGFMAVLPMVLNLPWNYYYNFVIEERHGFNKQTVKLWVTDQLKGLFLLGALGAPILAGFLKTVDYAGKRFVPYLMVFMIVLTLFMQLIYPTFIQPMFNKLTPLPEGELRQRVEKLAGSLGFPLKHLYVIDGSKRSGHSNAYFYGLPWSKHIVIYDTLIEKSTPAQVEAVLAHELGHWYYNHPTKLLSIAQIHLFATFTLFSIFIHNRSLYSSFGFDPRLATHSTRGGSQPVIIGFTLFQSISVPLDAIIQFFNNSLTRRFEYQADEFAVQLDKKEDLAKSLIGLHIDNLSSPHSDKIYSAYHHSHPTLPERLRAMREYSPAPATKEGKKDL